MASGILPERTLRALAMRCPMPACQIPQVPMRLLGASGPGGIRWTCPRCRVLVVTPRASLSLAVRRTIGEQWIAYQAQAAPRG